MKSCFDTLNIRLFLILLIVGFAIISCGPAEETDTVSPTEPADSLGPNESDNGVSEETPSGYPPPPSTVEFDSGSAYPPPKVIPTPVTVEAYPPPNPDENINNALADQSERFHLDLPLKANAESVSGKVPGQLNLVVVDITFAGIILGSGQSGEDGIFDIPVSPLPEGHRVGLTITEPMPGKSMTDTIFYLYDFRGEGYMNVPEIGIFFDSALVE